MNFTGTEEYVATSELQLAVNAAIALQKPLLIKGEPGTGKTMLAEQIARFPQRCMRSDRLSSYVQWGNELEDALEDEMDYGLAVIKSGETVEGARRFAGGRGRHGSFD